MSNGVAQRDLSWEEFLEVCLPEASKLIEDRSQPGLERYLTTVAAHACRLSGVAPPKRFATYPGFPTDCRFALTYRGPTFLAVQFELEPDAELPCHPHPGGSVCTLLLAGSARVRNFEFVAERPDWQRKGEVLVRNTRDDLLSPGRINLVGNPRDNIHGFRAGPDGARGIDITSTHFPEKRHKDSILEILEPARDAERRIHAALWTAVPG